MSLFLLLLLVFFSSRARRLLLLLPLSPVSGCVLTIVGVKASTIRLVGDDTANVVTVKTPAATSNSVDGDIIGIVATEVSPFFRLVLALEFFNIVW